MTEQPNPFSREGADGPPAQQPGIPEPPPVEPSGTGSETWPKYPAAPHAAGYDHVGLPTYGAGSPQPYGANTYDADQYGADTYGAGAYGASPYPTSYPGPNPYVPTQAATSPYGPTPPYGSNPYAAGPYGYTATNHPQAVASLVLGVVGLVICSYVGIAAFLVGRRARKEILAEPQRYSGLGMATAGWVMGIIGIVLAVLITLFFIVGLSGGFDN